MTSLAGASLRRSRDRTKWPILFLALLAFGAQAAPPAAAAKYRGELIRNTRFVWGLDGPVASEAAQVQQESGWDPTAHSSVAAGLAEFTPATATWISGAYKNVGAANPYNPSWALRALVTYDKDLWDNVSAIDSCERMAFALSAYNGGLGNVYKDQHLATQFDVPPGRWFGGVEYFSHRSASAFKENRGYPKRILLVLQPMYLSWGQGVDCSSAYSVTMTLTRTQVVISDAD